MSDETTVEDLIHLLKQHGSLPFGDGMTSNLYGEWGVPKGTDPESEQAILDYFKSEEK